MLATHGPQWFDRRRPENDWPSLVVSIAATAALFASAFVAMQTVRQWTRPEERAERPLVVRLTPPPPPLDRPRAEPVQPEPVSTPEPATRAVPPVTTVQPGVAAPANVEPRVVAPSLPGPPTVRDTAAGARPTPGIPLGPVPINRTGPDTAMAPRGGAPNVPAGVAIGSRTPNTAALRDSIGNARMLPIPWLAATRAPAGRELAELRQSQRLARAMYRRGTTAGNPNVHVALGEGMDGAGNVGGSAGVRGKDRSAGSGFALPLLSPGPSAAERRRMEALVKDYEDGLHRLHDRLRLRLDSLRRDSLRLDSLHRDSLARRRP
jgi:hypothetical protein